MEILKIGKDLFVNPSSLQWQESDLDSSEGSGRNVLGDMFRDRITVKRKLAVTFPPMLTSEMSKILKAIEPVFFDITYPDPKAGKNVTMNVYVSDRTVPVYCFDKDANEWLWQGLAIEFIER
ncbi:DUF6711 family protein [Thomasclavelia saccharogumia]|uniref:DUF6711 family protein n=1 Tax=Thomasclavelia saccharogumia TaxID=341225 RepID=UPI00047CBF70|nr:DUF6711 family protein [Thomasclavelia saccharogumia]